ncbi:otoancorin [Pungitius pungitius]|uniref:otoancorin n=1 Tax=Pungitius pungitius TaxID=134920 RepID=UPI002E167826
MAPNGGTFFFLLIVGCAALDVPPDGMPQNKCDFKDIAEKMMRKCQTEGYPVPERMQLETIFNYSDFLMATRNQTSGSLMSTFLNVLYSVTPDGVNEGKNKTWNFRDLPNMLRLMENSSVASACYMRAFVAPLCWKTLTTHNDDNMTADEYDALLRAAKPALLNMPLTGIDLPTDVGRGQNLEKIMEMLMEVYEAMSEDQRTQVVRWVKEQITLKYFNCTTRPPSDPRSMLMKSCKPSLKWLNTEALTMMGPYVSRLATKDVDSSPDKQLCGFFHSAQFQSTMSNISNINPSLGEKFLQKFQECFSGEQEFAENVDKLGILACYYSPAADLTPDISGKLLSELITCDDFSNPKITKMKKRLIESVMSKANGTEALGRLGRSVALLSPTQLSQIPHEQLKEFLKNMGPGVRWTKGQQRAVVDKLLCGECADVSIEELVDLQSVAGGLPSSVLKHVKSMPPFAEGLKNLTMGMKKGQLVAMLQGLLGEMDPSELVRKLSGPLLRRLPLNKLEEANIPSFLSLDTVAGKMWSMPQAAFLAKQMHEQKNFRWRPYSFLQGVPCEMIDNVADTDTQDMAQAVTGASQFLSKGQAGCAARKLFATKEKERADYFKTITEEEMKNIPTYLLLHLQPTKVRDLPASVCPAFLVKMQEADLSSLPHRSPSRAALTQRALRCLAEAAGVPGPRGADVQRLGPLLCELQPLQLLLVAPDVLNSSLQQMASCQHIPQRHTADMIQLVTQTFGDPSYWSAETMKAVGPLLLLDEDATSALPNKSWMKDVLYSLRSGMPHPSNALRRKLFDLITTTSNAGVTSSDDKEITVDLIEELGMDNVYWTHTQLALMLNETFLAAFETLGAVSDFRADQLAVLRKRATEAFGPVSQMTESVVMLMGCITPGFSNADLQKLPFSLDALEEIAKCGWNESQMASVWTAVSAYNNLTAQHLGAVEMVALSQFICGLSSTELQQLNVDAFKDAVGSMDGVRCSSEVMQQIKSLAVSAFGNPNTWTVAQVSELGNIMAGLNSTELASLDPAVFSFISMSCVPLIQHLKALSVVQVEALGPDSAAMVTSEQRATLSEQQLAALERAVTGSPDQTQTPGQSGTPSLNAEGISALVKPFLLLLTGFLLL